MGQTRGFGGKDGVSSRVGQTGGDGLRVDTNRMGRLGGRTNDGLGMEEKAGQASGVGSGTNGIGWGEWN